MPETTTPTKRAAESPAGSESVKKQKSIETVIMIKDLNDCDLSKKAISLIDNTSLDLEQETEESIKALCQSSVEEPPTAAVCVYPKWIKLCKEELKGTSVSVATVVNFPKGEDATDDVVSVTKQAVEDGVDEVDLVINYSRIMEDKESGVKEAEALTRKVKEACGSSLLKVIIEAGELKTEELIKAASIAAIRGGAHFIKTSTGKVPINATEENSRFMLEAISEAKAEAKENQAVVGFKAAGGVKTVLAVRSFLSMAESQHGTGFVSKETFRFGASSLLKILRAEVIGEPKVEDQPPAEGY